MNKIIKKISGFCLCKNVQFKAFLPVQWCSNCHCTRCQKGHGSGFVTWVGFKKDNFSVIKEKNFYIGILRQKNLNLDFVANVVARYYIGQLSVQMRFTLLW